MDGQDLREHLEAVNVAAQVEDLIMDGDVIGYDRVASVGSAVWVKGLASGDEMAVLASNYRGYRAVPRPEVVVPGPALRADFRSSVAAQAFGVAYNIAGGWTFDGQTAMAADANTYVRYKTTTADGMAAAMPSGSDWVVRLTYRETDAGSTQQLFTLGSGILRLHCLAGSRRLMCYPATALVEVPPSPGDWHEIAVHYRAATSRIDLYVDGLLRLADMRSEMNIYALSAIELRGPASFGDVRVGSLDPRSTPGSASPEGPSSVVLSLEVGGPSDVIDLDTRGFVGSVSPVANEVQVALDRTVRAFHVRPPVWADLHHDADVDADDFAAFWACVSGPGLPAVPEPPCPQADLDGDGDVDQEDFGLFQRCYSGPGIAPDCR